jgi:hypothetical protein
MTSSMNSAMSGISVSYFGEECDLEDCVDKTFKEIQTFVNGLHSGVRELAMIPEQDNDYERAFEVYTLMEKDVDGVILLFKEL